MVLAAVIVVGSCDEDDVMVVMVVFAVKFADDTDSAEHKLCACPDGRP